MIIQTHDLGSLSERVVMVDGGFDPLHAGHIAYFREAASLGLPVLCNVRSDAYMPSAKSRPNLLPEGQRAQLLDALEMIDYVHLCDTSTLEVLRRLAPAVYVKGADWRGRLPAEELDTCVELGIDLRFAEFTVETSSTELVRSFLERAALSARPEVNHPRLVTSSTPMPSSPPYVAVLTSHTNRYLSGVAKFSALLAERLGIPCVPLVPEHLPSRGPVLVSIKLADCPEEARAVIHRVISQLRRNRITYDVFLHSFDGSTAECRLIAGCRQAFAGNAELADSVRSAGERAVALWCPALVDTGGLDHDAALSIFSFGMAHKVQASHYTRLHDLLELHCPDYALLVSTAFHEKASFGYIDDLERRFRETFGKKVHLLGFLSDPSVNHFLQRADAFCAFFPAGVRANNTSVLAAMAAGTPVITNMDRYSPQWMRHGETVLDIAQLTAHDLTSASLQRVGRNGMNGAASHAGWEELLERLQSDPDTRAPLDAHHAALVADGG